MSKAPTAKQRIMWEAMREGGCIVADCERCDVEIHHCGTGGGGRKDHEFVAPLCVDHHTGRNGIHTIGRRKFAELHGTEKELHERAKNRLTE